MRENDLEPDIRNRGQEEEIDLGTTISLRATRQKQDKLLRERIKKAC